jgi:uncharacterized repeat protein (TIGR02543 family)
MAHITYNNLLGIAHTNPTDLLQWDAGVATTTTEPPVNAIGDKWFDESIDTLYTATLVNDWTGATAQVIPVAEYEHILEGDMWFDELTNKLYTAEAGIALPYTLLVPTATDGFIFAGWSTDPYGHNMVTEITTTDDETLYAQWWRIGKHLVLHIYEIDDFRYRINVDFIVEVKPVAVQVAGTKKFRIQITVSPGTQYYLNDVYNNLTEALAAREAFLALTV